MLGGVKCLYDNTSYSWTYFSLRVGRGGGVIFFFSFVFLFRENVFMMEVAGLIGLTVVSMGKVLPVIDELWYVVECAGVVKYQI